jgi:hypothetical protein
MQSGSPSLREHFCMEFGFPLRVTYIGRELLVGEYSTDDGPEEMTLRRPRM